MRPFMEYIHPETGRKQRVEWDKDRSRAKMMEFRAEAIRYFVGRDIERARAAGITVADDAPGLPTGEFQSDGTFIVDPIASRIKHSGEEVKNRWLPRWQEFCSKPQNEEDAEYPMVTHKPRRVEIEEPPTRTLEEVKTEGKRGPGRPRRQALVNV